MKKYIPFIILTFLSLITLSCVQNDDRDENQISHTNKKENQAKKERDTLRQDSLISHDDPPVKDTHDWRIIQ
ncbi:hypothetical protein [Chryseobacterium sp. ISL-6]|uniref:hypothetical protein n=1 Tax=Chryseobacterium sp. ISL-6 TaxID=2819143 RepID=UPI001BE893A6|nr:hypothetical protein [Chryseobacterium sp. ISL-6]MBT2623757.1 hypothetical protein [Chryseobacterium sp. ISL-6]